ncbi:MAG TPA: hypothetical protein VGR72_12010 [Candidatus Acidoferrales bacterium]|nr:hypothetical protein [Candidatus Acidoferrales bacterium]
MSASPKTVLVKESLRGTLRIVKEGFGSISVYDVTFCTKPGDGATLQPLRLANSGALVELLDRLHIDFRQAEVREAVEDVLLRGTGYIPNLVFSQSDLREAGLA